MKREILGYIDECSLDELSPVLDIIIKKANQERSQKNGLVPLKIFPKLLAMYGAYFSIEIIVEIINDEEHTLGYAFKRRGNEEQGYV